MSKGRQKSSKYKEKEMPKRGKKVKSATTLQTTNFLKKEGSKTDDSEAQEPKMSPSSNCPSPLLCLYDHSTPVNVLGDDWKWSLKDLLDSKLGTELWDYQSKHPTHWGNARQSYLDNSINPPNTKFWEEYACDMMELADNDVDCLNFPCNWVLDYSKLVGSVSHEETIQWKHQKFLQDLAISDTLMAFSFNEKELEGKLFYRYWERSLEANPKLFVKGRPLVMFWILASRKFQHPWVDPNKSVIQSIWTDLQKQQQGYNKRQSEEIRKLENPQAINSPARPANKQKASKIVTPDNERDDTMDTQVEDLFFSGERKEKIGSNSV